MLFVGRLVGKIDVRLIIGTGFALTALSLWQMTHFSMLMDMRPLIESGVIQGLGTGIAYVPMSALAFATLAGPLRNEGTALFNLMRNIGSSIGIAAVQALLVHNTQVVHASLAAHLTPRQIANAHVAGAQPGHALAAINAAVTAQAQMIAYIDDFQLMFLLAALSIPLLLLVRNPKRRGDAPHVAVE
jgi:DHA2 family multidrug resistance protein